jgi:putative heme iron utilization protein
MNEDHEDAMLLIAEHLGGVKGEKATMHEVDRYGYELKVDGKPLRLTFSQAVEKPDQVRQELVRATRAAREALGVTK